MPTATEQVKAGAPWAIVAVMGVTGKSSCQYSTKYASYSADNLHSKRNLEASARFVLTY